MKLTGLATVIAAITLCLQSTAMAANFTIDNPADKIDNPASRIYNPASNIKNPAANIYNPAAHMDNPSPLSPPTQPVPPPTAKESTATEAAEQIKAKQRPKTRTIIPRKEYHFKSVKTYITAAKRAFNQDNYMEFLAITEDALRRISAGTLRASKKSKQTLLKYKTFGYGLLEKPQS